MRQIAAGRVAAAKLAQPSRQKKQDGFLGWRLWLRRMTG
jgi:hypothetical protein